MSRPERICDEDILTILRDRPVVSPELTETIIARISADASALRRPWQNQWWVVAICGAGAALALLIWINTILFDLHTDEFSAGERTASAAVSVERVRFALRADQATSVSVVGDFNNWNSNATPLSRLPSGEWVLEISLRPGRYTYAYLVDGRRWQPDPTAPLVADADFGRPGSVLLVGAEL